MENRPYQDYFNINPKFYAEVTEDLIASGLVSWKDFYPHATFVKLLQKVCDVLSGKTPSSLWVEGAYGTGKSHAALAVKSMLEASDDEVKEYFADFKLSQDLCQKLLTVKNAGKLLIVHRMGSGSIRTDQDLILAMQDSIMRAMAANGIENQGEASLRDAVLKWFEKDASRDYFNRLISEDEAYAWKFGNQKVEDIIQQLKAGSPERVTKLMRLIMEVAKANGITGLLRDIQDMAAWIKSIIDENHLKAILFIWDEFTEFFLNNPNSLTGFQTLAEISLSKPFYFMIITHQSRSLFQNTETSKKILDRFVPPIDIKLPENTAFHLMAAAMRETDDVEMKKQWAGYKSELNSNLETARAIIQDGVRKSSDPGQISTVSDEELQSIVPIHPYAALLLKHLSVAFKSNQRSMFNFIIRDDPDVHAFKWFIREYGPLSTTNLLTIDMLWDFFYGNGDNGLNDDVRVILNSYNLLDASKLSTEDQRVLKTILLLQAISMRVGSVELLRPNELNVELAFSGTDWQQNKATSIAKKLVQNQVLFTRPVSSGKTEYTVANSTGDAATISKKKEEIAENTKTQDLIVQGNLLSAVQLPAPISKRFVLEAAAAKNFNAIVSKVSSNASPNRFQGIVTFARDDVEATQLQGQILRAMQARKDSLLIIDAGLTPLGKDLFDQYTENMAYSSYYAQNDKRRAKDYQSQAERCLKEWKDKIQAGAFMLYSDRYLNGVRVTNLPALVDELSEMNHHKYPYGLEQMNVSDALFGEGAFPQGAELGIGQKLTGRFKSALEKNSLSTALKGAWNVERYWEDPAKRALPIVQLKLKVEQIISEGFQKRAERVSLFDLFQQLTDEPFGLMPNNITAFVLGFVLKEYAQGDFFWTNGSTTEIMTPDKMKSAIANVLNQRLSPARNFKEEFIARMGENHRAFLKCTTTVFNISEKQCGNVEDACKQLRITMKRFSFPIWCVKGVLNDEELTTPTAKLKEIIDSYCLIANTANGNQGNESEIAESIGKAVRETPEIVADLAKVINSDNCRKGMLAYIDHFEGGVLKQLAAQIGDNGAYLDVVKDRFNVDAANWAWNTETADNKIRDVILEYRIIDESNKSLPKCRNIREVITGWNNRAKNIRMPYETIKPSAGDLAPFLEALYSMSGSKDLPDQKRARFYELLLACREDFDHFYSNQVSVFKQVAAPFLGDLKDHEITMLYNDLNAGQFMKQQSEYFQHIERLVKEFQDKQLKKQLRNLWQEKTGSKDPAAWSSKYDTPILCMFDDGERVEAKRVFTTMLSNSPSDAEVNYAIQYLQKATFYDRLADEDERDRCFAARVMGDYAILLNDLQEVREYISDNTRERAYDWFDNSAVRNLIGMCAEKQYKRGGYEQVMNIIDQMDSSDLRVYLKDLISTNVTVGIQILRKKK